MKLSLSDRLRSDLASPALEPPIAGDLPEERAKAWIPAAVLIAVTDRPDPGVILTVRREDMRTHAGQIAFPGGRADLGEDAIDAALRESLEEIGLERAKVDVIGALDEYRTVSGYVITPVIGVIPTDLPLRPHEKEVASWFEAPFHHLLDPANRRVEHSVFGGRERHYWVIEWAGNRIWGATAAILVNLSRRLQWRS